MPLDIVLDDAPLKTSGSVKSVLELILILGDALKGLTSTKLDDNFVQVVRFASEKPDVQEFLSMVIGLLNLKEDDIQVLVKKLSPHV